MKMATLKLGIAAGLAGGAAEVIWIAGYGVVTGTPPEPVARAVASALLPVNDLQWRAAGLGITLHMLLAVALGIAVVVALQAPVLRRLRGWPQSAVVVLALGGVWSFNFFIVLPEFDPDFLTLLPLAVTLASKLLFGASAAAILRGRRATLFQAR